MAHRNIALTSQSRFLFYTLGLAYISTGILAVLPGTAILALAANTGVSLAVVGWAFTGSASGFTVGAWIAGILVSRVNARYLLMIGLGLMALTSAVTPWTNSFTVLLGSQFVRGIGFGFVDVSVNAIVTLAFASTLSETLNNVHSTYGIGALIGPLLLSFSLQLLNSVGWAFVIGSVLGAMTVVLLMQQRVPDLPQKDETESEARVFSTRKILLSGLLWLLALQLALYVGAEIGFGNWIVTAVSKSATISLALAAPAATFFSLGLTLGRLASGLVLRRNWLTEKALLYTGILGGTVSGLIVALFPGQIVVSFGVSGLVGFFYGPLFPGIMAIASRWFVHALGLVSSVMLISTGVLAMILPAAMGMLIPPLGMHWALVIPALTCSLIAVPLALAMRQQRGGSAGEMAKNLQDGNIPQGQNMSGT